MPHNVCSPDGAALLSPASRLTEAEANTLGFSVDRHEGRWWGICSKADRPFVSVHYRQKYASLWSDDITAHHRPPDPWHEYPQRLSQLTGLASRRTIEHGYTGTVYFGHNFITTCPPLDAVCLARVLVEVWDGDTTSLERLHGEWGGDG